MNYFQDFKKTKDQQWQMLPKYECADKKKYLKKAVFEILEISFLQNCTLRDFRIFLEIILDKNT